MSDNIEGNHRDWSLLLHDLLGQIASHLHGIHDHLNFRGVCVSWRRASKSITPKLPLQFPWIFERLYTGTYRFAILSANEQGEALRTMTLPTSGFNDVSPSGWTIHVALRNPNNEFHDIHLLNQITNYSIALPPLLVKTGVIQAKLFGSNFLALVCCYNNADTTSYYDVKFLQFCRMGDNNAIWKTIQIVTQRGVHGYINRLGDFVYHKGSFFVYVGHHIWVFDAQTSLQKVAEIPLGFLLPQWPTTCHRTAGCCSKHMVESPSGEYLLQVVKRGRHYEQAGGKQFRVLRLIDEKTGEWAEVSNIGDGVLFVDCHQTMCFAAADIKGCKPNCIYFLESYGVRLFDIATGQPQKDPVFSSVSSFSWLSARWINLNVRLLDFGKQH